jgi:hypothetical protein
MMLTRLSPSSRMGSELARVGWMSEQMKPNSFTMHGTP